MQQITKNEAMAVRNRYPRVHIRKTRHKYYMEQDYNAVLLVSRLRSGQPVDDLMKGKDGVRHGAAPYDYWRDYSRIP